MTPSRHLNVNTRTPECLMHIPPLSNSTLDHPNWTRPLPDSEDWVMNRGAHSAVKNLKPHIISSLNAPDSTNIDTKLQPRYLHSSVVQNTLYPSPNEIVRF
ncbi:hypothetical protein V5O48_013172 [Marasmius crinis-equi]|uniref:Uncharacterized protein n=1 Tax=Marasmius crinis-equi TaxID=585013 RepID=A0ABR3F0S9_9AGAR